MGNSDLTSYYNHGLVGIGLVQSYCILRKLLCAFNKSLTPTLPCWEPASRGRIPKAIAQLLEGTSVYDTIRALFTLGLTLHYCTTTERWDKTGRAPHRKTSQQYRSYADTRQTALFLGLLWRAGTREVTNLHFTEGRDREWQWHQLGHMQVCTSLQTDNHASTPPLSFHRTDALPVAQPTASKHRGQINSPTV